MQYQVVSSPWLHKATPIALSVVAGAGVVGTAVLAAKATPDAIERKKEAEEKKGEPLTKWEAFKAMFPSYIPAGTTGIITLASIAGLSIHDNATQSKLAGVVASGNQIINGISHKYATLRNEIAEKHPEILRDFDEKSLNDQWEKYVKERMKLEVKCWGPSLPLEDSSEYGEPRMFGIEYGNGLCDENGHEIIFFEATPGDVIAAFYNLNGLHRQNGFIKVNDLFRLLEIPKTDLGERLVWDACVMWEEWDSDFIHFSTEDIPLEEGVPQPAVCTMIYFKIPPLAEQYAEDEEIPCPIHPTE